MGSPQLVPVSSSAAAHHCLGLKIHQMLQQTVYCCSGAQRWSPQLKVIQEPGLREYCLTTLDGLQVLHPFFECLHLAHPWRSAGISAGSAGKSRAGSGAGRAIGAGAAVFRGRPPLFLKGAPAGMLVGAFRSERSNFSSDCLGARKVKKLACNLIKAEMFGSYFFSTLIYITRRLMHRQADLKFMTLCRGQEDWI